MSDPAEDLAATPFEDVDVEKDVERDGRPPDAAGLSDDEMREIDRQVAEIVTANQGRGAGEQVSVAAEDVS